MLEFVKGVIVLQIYLFQVWVWFLHVLLYGWYLLCDSLDCVFCCPHTNVPTFFGIAIQIPTPLYPLVWLWTRFAPSLQPSWFYTLFLLQPKVFISWFHHHLDFFPKSIVYMAMRTRLLRFSGPSISFVITGIPLVSPSKLLLCIDSVSTKFHLYPLKILIPFS